MRCTGRCSGNARGWLQRSLGRCVPRLSLWSQGGNNPGHGSRPDQPFAAGAQSIPKVFSVTSPLMTGIVTRQLNLDLRCWFPRVGQERVENQQASRLLGELQLQACLAPEIDDRPPTPTFFTAPCRPTSHAGLFLAKRGMVCLKRAMIKITESQLLITAIT